MSRIFIFIIILLQTIEALKIILTKERTWSEIWKILKSAIRREYYRGRMIYFIRCPIWKKQFSAWKNEHWRQVEITQTVVYWIIFVCLTTALSHFLAPIVARLNIPTVAGEQCWHSLCVVPQDLKSGNKIFGFAEFISALALLVLIWTMADVRYRFRIAVAPIRLYLATFRIMAILGLLTLATDFWRSSGYPVPRSYGLSYSAWQAILGSIFFSTFVTWVYYAFASPPAYNSRNALRFIQNLYQHILKGSSSDLPVIADELIRSIPSLVRNATNHERYPPTNAKPANRPPIQKIADDILLLIGDKKFCKNVVESSPGTALVLFQEIARTGKYGAQVEIFGRNITEAAIENATSFIYQETEGYKTGFMGIVRPMSQAIYGSYALVERVGTLLDAADYKTRQDWEPALWGAYCRLVLVTLKDYVDKGCPGHSFTLHRAMGSIKGAASDIYKINGMSEGGWQSDPVQRLDISMNFIKAAIELLDEKPPGVQRLRMLKNDGRRYWTIYDTIAEMVFDIIFYASKVTEPWSLSWSVQQNEVWSQLFGFDHMSGPAANIVKFKVRRLIFEEIVRMDRFPNFKGASILGFCLNVMGINNDDKRYDKDYRALHKVVLAWTKKRYAWLVSYNAEVAANCLVPIITYDATSNSLIRTQPKGGLQRQANLVRLQLEPAAQPPNFPT